MLLIGAITLQWSRVESLPQRIVIALCAESASAGSIVVTNLNYRSLDHSLRVFVETSDSPDDDFKDELPALLDEVARLYALRNFVAHNTWPESDKEGHFSASVFRFKGKARISEEFWKPGQLYNIYTDLVELLLALSALIFKYDLNTLFEEWEQRAASQGKFAPQRFAEPPSRSQESEAVIRQLLSSEQ